MSLFAGTELYRPPKCDRCDRLESECDCGPIPEAPLAPGKQRATVTVEKRKRGKLVTVIRGLAAGTPEPHLSQLLGRLKTDCGAGGSIQEGALEIQGNHQNRLVTLLSGMGYRVKTG